MATSRICGASGCDKPHNARGYCRIHLHRFKKYGDPLGGPTFYGEPKDWLERHVGWLADECLMWPYAMRPEGYGRFKEGGTQQYAHRTMCRLAHGEPPSDGLEAAHSCGNGQIGCVNPRHLRWDTKQGNALDRVEHGTENRGERNGRAKLTAGQVLQIRRSTETQQSVADRMGISRQTVGDIRSGRRWGWMT